MLESQVTQQFRNRTTLGNHNSIFRCFTPAWNSSSRAPNASSGISSTHTPMCLHGEGEIRERQQRQKDKEIKNNSFGRWLFLLLVLDILSQAFWSYAKEVHHGQRKLLSSRLLGGKQKEKHLRFQHHLQKHASKDLILFSFGIPLKSLPAVPHVGGDIAFST